MQIQITNIDDLRKAADILKEQPEILAVEFLDRKNIFGNKATIEEMSRFKSKVKRQKPELERPQQKEEN